MEPRIRTRALTAVAVALTAGFTLGTTLLPSSAHAAEPPRGTATAGVRSASPQGLTERSTLGRIGAALSHTR